MPDEYDRRANDLYAQREGEAEVKRVECDRCGLMPGPSNG